MPEPIYSETTERFYGGLPGVYRFEDSQNDWQFKRWLSGVLEELGAVDVLIDRFKYVPPEDGPELQDLSSDLVNPQMADEAWLPWLAQLVGIHFYTTLTTQQKRDRISGAIGGPQPGTKASIILAAQTVLTGTKTVYVYPFSDNVGGIGAGSQWDVLVMTKQDETVSDPVAAIIALGAKPAGVRLFHVYYGATWNTVEAEYPNWNEWEGNTWQTIEQTEN